MPCSLPGHPASPANSLYRLRGAGFDLACNSAAWWDGRAPWFLDEHEALRQVAPSVGSPEPSFLERLASRLPPDADPAAAYRLALNVTAAVSAGLFVPMGFEYATTRRFDPVRASPADLAAARHDAPVDLTSAIIAANLLIDRLPAPDLLRPVTAPGASVTAWLRAAVADIRDAREASLLLLNPDILHAAPVPVSLTPLPPAAGAPLSVRDSDTPDRPLYPGEVRVLACRRTADIRRQDLPVLRRAAPPGSAPRRTAPAGAAPPGSAPPGSAPRASATDDSSSGDTSAPPSELTAGWARSTRIAVEAVEPVVTGWRFCRQDRGRPKSYRQRRRDRRRP